MENSEGSIFAWLFGCSVVCLAGDSSYVTLAFEDAQDTPPFSKEETENTDDTDNTGDKDDTNDTDDTDDTDFLRTGIG